MTQADHDEPVDSAAGALDDRPEPTPKKRDWVLFGLRGAGQTLITAGVVILLFVVYEVWITNIFTHIEQTKIKNQLVQEWAKGEDPIVGLPGTNSSSIPTGTGIANLYIPRFGQDYQFAIVEGTDQNALAKGPGHYGGTALPGQVGNFSVAGHRVGKGEPFLNLDELQPGDPVVVQTASTWFVYRVLGDTSTKNLTTPDAQGVVGREIVAPSDGKVILPVPNKPGTAASQALMTMTTCTPKFTATDRMIVHAVLATTYPTSGAKPPADLLAAIGGTL
ncbi:MAG: class E sortase [Actinobacteria bacterium]|nr:class E sortase [Actinomycetota bacterium]